MIPYVRRTKMLELLKMRGIVYLDDFVSYTGVSIPTIRRDLRVLKEEGSIEILQGGAAKLIEKDENKPVEQRMELNLEEKALLCTVASDFIKDGDLIYIGPGTTEDYIIKHLAGKDVTVVTNGIFHIAKLAENGIRTKIVGGDLKSRIGIVVGSATINALNNFNFDKCFIGANGITVDGGAMTISDEVAEINKVILNKSKESYLLVDSTKFGKTVSYSFAGLNKFTKIITTNKVSEEYSTIENILITGIDDIKNRGVK